MFGGRANALCLCCEVPPDLSLTPAPSGRWASQHQALIRSARSTAGCAPGYAPTCRARARALVSRRTAPAHPPGVLARGAAMAGATPAAELHGCSSTLRRSSAPHGASCPPCRDRRVPRRLASSGDDGRAAPCTNTNGSDRNLGGRSNALAYAARSHQTEPDACTAWPVGLAASSTH
jgi:hypothetical protein